MNTKGISLFYSLLDAKNTFTKLPPMLNRERDISRSFSPVQWSTALAFGYKAIHASNLWELIFKINLRWYITPTQTQNDAPSVVPTCWRNCGEISNLLHISWGCNKTLKFWADVFVLIGTVIKTPITPSPEPSILNIEIEKLPFRLQCMTTHILLAHHCQTLEICGSITNTWGNFFSSHTWILQMHVCIFRK